MSQGFYIWSHTAATNANADASINFSEGQAPSSVNDSARALMARASEYRDDIAGAIVTGGTSTAYTVSSFQVFDSLAHLNGQMIAFSPHATNGATVTLNVDSLGAKPLRTSPGVELLAGMIIQGTPYVATFNNSDGAFYLQGLYGNPYNVPLLGGMDYWDTIAPNSSFIFPAGQAISRTTYSATFARWGTTYGAGDGSTTFNVPDKTGRVSVMKEATATRLTTAGSGVDGGTMGANGGAQNITMARANLPNTSVSVTITDPGHTHGSNANQQNTSANQGAAAAIPASSPATISSATTGISAAFNLNGNVTQTAMIVAQPTIVTNYILRII